MLNTTTLSSNYHLKMYLTNYHFRFIDYKRILVPVLSHYVKAAKSIHYHGLSIVQIRETCHSLVSLYFYTYHTYHTLRYENLMDTCNCFISWVPLPAIYIQC